LSEPPSIAQITHRIVLSSAGRIHLVEQGSGPLVLLVHGFPEFWYSWPGAVRLLVSQSARRRSYNANLTGPVANSA
jgi:pimeloyl-ACP methyl ester carboxylesterase